MIGRQIFREIRLLVGNEGGFVHKRLLGGIKGFVSGGFNPLAAARGFLETPTRRPRPRTTRRQPQPRSREIINGADFVPRLPTRRTLPRTITARPSVTGAQEKELGKAAKFGGGGIIEDILDVIRPRPRLPIPIGPTTFGPTTPCDPPLVRGPRGNCIFPGSPVGADVFRGEAIMGQYGAGMVAGSQIVDRATCGRGMQLGDDGICYNKSQIRNNQRMWPAGRKPLLSGGDMRAISIAARAGKRMDGATKRLQKMGMMKKAATRRATPAGHVAKLEHASEH